MSQTLICRVFNWLLRSTAGRDEDREFPFWLSEVFEKPRYWLYDQFLVHFGELPGHDNRMILLNNQSQILERPSEAVRSFVEDDDPRLSGEILEPFISGIRPNWWETKEGEFASGNTRRGQGRENGARSGHTLDAEATGPSGSDQGFARIRHQRRTGIRDQRDRFSPAQPGKQRRRLTPLVVLAEARRGRRDGVVLKQPAGPASILSRDQGDLAQNSEGPQGDIFEVADGRGDHIQDAGHARGADSTRMYSAEPLPHFVDEYLAWLHEAHPTNATFDGVHLHDDLLEDLSRGAIDQQVRALGGFARRLAAIDPARLTDVERLERPALDGSIRARLFELEIGPLVGAESAALRRPHLDEPRWTGTVRLRAAVRARAPRAVEAATRSRG